MGAATIKDEVEFKVVVKKIRHRFYETECPVCHHRENVTVPASLKEENQYGTGVQALALTMLNEGFVSMKRTKEIVCGLTAGEVNLSEGYIAKLQKRLFCYLSEFQKELRKQIISLSNRTVAMMRTRLVVGTVEGKAGFEITMKLDLFTNGGFVFTENTSNIGFGRFVVNPLSDNLTVSFRKMFIIS